MSNFSRKKFRELMREARRELNEGGFLRLHRILLGMVPSVDTLAILTAWNPNAEELSRAENNQRNKMLFRDLKNAGYGPIKIKGSFGNFERSFMIPNMSKEHTIAAGNDYGQMAVIWGSKTEDDEGNPKIVFEYIEGRETIQKRDVVLVGIQKAGNGDPEDIQQRPDYYSEKAGRKFVIPFFDEKFEFELDDGGLKEVLLKEQVPNSVLAQKLLSKIEVRKKKLHVEGASRKYYWHHRCVLREHTIQLKKLADTYNNIIR